MGHKAETQKAALVTKVTASTPERTYRSRSLHNAAKRPAMRQLQDIEKRWSLLFNTSIAVDLRQATRDDGDFDPCEDGLRSVCWKSFLLTGPLSQASWSRKLKDQRSGYASLRDHFLKYIDNPNDLHSSADPLADDETVSAHITRTPHCI